MTEEAQMETGDWWVGTSDEFMNIGGPLLSREAAIEEGRGHQGGDPFWICRATLHTWAPPSAESVMDLMADQSDEYWFDDGFPGFDGGKDAEKAAEADLQQVLNEWFARHLGIFPAPTAFAASSATEQIDAPPAAPADVPSDPHRDNTGIRNSADA
jgi:hypothetical protein